MGNPIGDEFLFNNNFADDQLIIAQDPFNLEFMLRKLHLAHKEYGLNDYLDETDYLMVITK